MADDQRPALVRTDDAATIAAQARELADIVATLHRTNMHLADLMEAVLALTDEVRGVKVTLRLNR
jgi:hypothetical protein